jgi:hypothetical protein
LPSIASEVVIFFIFILVVWSVLLLQFP